MPDPLSQPSNELNDSAEPLSAEEIERIVKYWEQPTGMVNAPGGMVEYAQVCIAQLIATIDALTERAERAERDAEYNEHACEVSNRMLTATKVAAEHRIEERDPVRGPVLQFLGLRPGFGCTLASLTQWIVTRASEAHIIVIQRKSWHYANDL